MSCLSPNSFNDIDPYHNNIGINTINELVADLHRHEDFIGTNRSNILGTTDDNVTTQLQNFDSGKNAIVTTLSSIANNLISLIDVTVDEYSWCDPDESEYSGPRTIANYPDGVFDHWNWPSIINGIINILQNLLCICLVESELPEGEDIIFSSFITFDPAVFGTGDLMYTRYADDNNVIAHNNFISSEGNCTPGDPLTARQGFGGYPAYIRAGRPENTPVGWSDCVGNTDKQVVYENAIYNLIKNIGWLGVSDGQYTFPQPTDIPFEFVESQLVVGALFGVRDPSGVSISLFPDLPLTNNNLAINCNININNKTFFEGEISVHDPVFYPEGAPTLSSPSIFLPYNGILFNNWGELIPDDFLLHSQQDTIELTWDHSSLPLLESPIAEEDIPSNSEVYTMMRIRTLVLKIKARRPA